MRRPFLLLASCLLAFAAAAQAPSPQRADPGKLRALDREIWQPFSAAFAEGRVEDYIALHSRALVRVLGDERRIDSYDAWEKQTRAMFAALAARGVKAAIRFRFTERIAGTESASERGVFELTLQPAKGESRRVYGRFHVLARREDGRWKILADYDNSEGGRVGAADFEAAHAADDHARY